MLLLLLLCFGLAVAFIGYRLVICRGWCLFSSFFLSVCHVPCGGGTKVFFSFFLNFLGFFCFLCCSVISVSCACRIQYHEHGNWGCRKTTHNEDKETTPQFNPFRTAVRFWGQTTQFSSRLSNKTGLRFQRG